MQKALLILFSILSISCLSQSKNSSEETYVLFIGNSLTYYNGMPEFLQKMIDENQQKIIIEKSTFGGMSLSAHLNKIIESSHNNGFRMRKKQANELTETEKKIAERKWDVVILQEGTIRLLIPESKEFQVNPAIKRIIKLIDNPNCRIFIFNTWPSKEEYPKQYCYPSIFIDRSIIKDKCCSLKIKNLEQEVKLINKAYTSVARANSIEKTNNGDKFFDVLTNYPEIELYEDESHPSELGAFLNACIFYQILTEQKASSLKFNGGIDEKTAELLKIVAE